MGSRQVEKRHCRRRCLVRAVPLKAGDACGRWKTLLRFLPGADRERVLLAPENALFISLGQACVFSCPSTFGLQSSLFLESPDLPLPPPLPRGPAPTTPCPSVFSTDFSWLCRHCLDFSRSVLLGCLIMGLLSSWRKLAIVILALTEHPDPVSSS